MALARNDLPPPFQDPIGTVRPPRRRGEEPGVYVSLRSWIDWFTNAIQLLGTVPAMLKSARLTNQSASVAATDFSDGELAAGYYRISYEARVTQAATTSSSLTVTLDWVDEGVTQTFAGAAMTGNTTTTRQSDTQIIYTDGSSPVRYTLTYASVGATSMQYKFAVFLEEVQA